MVAPFYITKFCRQGSHFSENLSQTVVLHSVFLLFRPIYCPKKRDHNVYCNIIYKTRTILMKFSTQFPQ